MERSKCSNYVPINNNDLIIDCGSNIGEFRHCFKNKIEYVDISSYKGNERGEIKSLPFEINIQNQNILIIDDICDTGNTLSYITDLINKNNPKSVRTSVLLKKKIKRNEPCYCGSGKKFKHCCGAL